MYPLKWNISHEMGILVLELQHLNIARSTWPVGDPSTPPAPPWLGDWWLFVSHLLLGVNRTSRKTEKNSSLAFTLTIFKSRTPSLASWRRPTNFIVRSPKLFSWRVGVERAASIVSHSIFGKVLLSSERQSLLHDKLFMKTKLPQKSSLHSKQSVHLSVLFLSTLSPPL